MQRGGDDLSRAQAIVRPNGLLGRQSDEFNAGRPGRLPGFPSDLHLASVRIRCCPLGKESPHIINSARAAGTWQTGDDLPANPLPAAPRYSGVGNLSSRRPRVQPCEFERRRTVDGQGIRCRCDVEFVG